MVDNASSNDKAIAYLLRKQPNLYDEGRHFHIRCMAHILNLILKDGLRENNYHVECIRKAVRHIRNSTQIMTKFKKCIEESNVQSSRFLCGDMPTRWNSTYEMLKTAVDLREVFFSYEVQDSSYIHDLERLPEHSDFGACEKLVELSSRLKKKLHQPHQSPWPTYLLEKS
ncbi:zinc finger BED domain-containing protein RICESLEEPER 3-like [Bidens hawaiensis]|uniref:zinc finger BED domain-containing protein RICESLEEPER 3-like n=1 Tax=Bidens hawaiensis TaxID=980011 RepID=UPI004049B194